MFRHAAIAVLIAGSAAAGEAGPDAAAIFASGEADQLWQRLSPDMQEAVGSADALAELRAGLGDETQMIAESSLKLNGLTTYRRLSEWDGSDEPLMLTLASDDAGEISGFLLTPEPRLPDDDAPPVSGLQLPFAGEWLVFWGGDDLAHNYHAADPAQRYAVDLVIAEGGASFDGDPLQLESYHCWDQPILAPAAGRVVAAIGDLPDQPIGESDESAPAGNHVVIETAPQRYLFLAHLRQGSLGVAQGDEVAAGQQIGTCGNSGNTSEPHLHIHAQTEPVLGQGTGLPLEFTDYLSGGARVENGALLRGQIVAPAG
ncbi:MAG: M23 family metallopeptidase [Paracoccus sp. (in: a-proteobacteria)]|nr:M23 family metallopeptidase [Paracoccus sp. (in: a-proteobacteria)]